MEGGNLEGVEMPESVEATGEAVVDIKAEVARRRNFAIISHPGEISCILYTSFAKYLVR